MAKRKLNQHTPKKFRGVDPLALAELRAMAVDARAQSEQPLTEEQETSWTPDVASALDRRHAMHFYALRGKLLRQALTDSRLSVKALALKAGEVLDDRLRGRPQSVEPPHGGVTVIFQSGKFGGLDPSKLPDAGTKPALPKEGKPVVDVPPKRAPVRENDAD